MRLRFLVLFFISLAFSCKNLDDAKPLARNTFVHFFGGGDNFVGIAAEPIDDGFLIVGDSVGEAGFGIVVIKADLYGKVVWRKLIPDGIVNSVKVGPDGYFLIGDRIQVDLAAEQVSDQIKRKMRLLKIDANGTKILDRSFGTFNPDSTRVDFRGYGINISSSGNIITTGSIKFQGARAQSITAEHNPSDFKISNSLFKTFDLDNRDYINCKSVFETPNQKIIWATSATLDQANTTRSYLAVPVLDLNSSFENSALYGRNDDQFYSGSDIKPTSTGYGIIGTYKTVTGTNANIYFVKADPEGNIIAGSDTFFDGDLVVNNSALTDKNTSSSQDEGSALINTDDGGFLLGGNMTTTADRGNGGKDILLIKIDAFGKVMWNKLIGGTGDETVSTIRQTADGGFLICGTLNLAGLSSIYMAKVNKNGAFAD